MVPPPCPGWCLTRERPRQRFETYRSAVPAGYTKGVLMRSRFPAFNTRVLTAVLLVALPVLLVGLVVVLSIGQGRLRDTHASSLAQDAEYTAATLDAYVFRRIL